MFSEPRFHFCNKNRYLRSRPMRNDRKTLCFLLRFVKIDENRCTVVQNQPCRPSARPPARPPIRPSARPSARPPGPGPAEPIYVNSRSTAMGGCYSYGRTRSERKSLTLLTCYGQSRDHHFRRFHIDVMMSLLSCLMPT